MRHFNGKIFLAVFTIGLAIPSLYFGLLALIPNRSPTIAANILMGILFVVVAFALLSACYRYPVRWYLWIYRAAMRRLAKRAIRLSWSRAMKPVRCLGIMEREGYVYLRLGIGSSAGIIEGFPFQLFESTGNQLWGIVEVVSVDEHRCDCIPIIRINENFWAALEGKMKNDTSPPPNVHLVVGYPPPVMEKLTEWLLDNWR